MANKKVKICQACSTTFKGRKDAKTCSPACRKRLQRNLQTLTAQKTRRLESALGKEFHRIAASLLQDHVVHEPFVLADESGGVPVSVLEPQPQETPPAVRQVPVTTVAPTPAAPAASTNLVTTVAAVNPSLAQIADSSLEADELENEPIQASVAGYDNSVVDRRAARSSRFSLFNYNKFAISLTGIAMVLITAIGALGFAFLSHQHSRQTLASGQKAGSYAGGNLPLGNLKSGSQLEVGQAKTVLINGRLRVSNTLVLLPAGTPANPETGQFYYDKTTNVPYFYNGTQFISLAPQHVTSIGGSSGIIGLDSSLGISNNQLGVSTSILQQIANNRGGGSGVTSVQGQTGDVTLSAGSGISINGTNISNSGVLSLTGTADQVNVSGGTGNVVLSLPQSIAVTSTPTFGGLTVNGTIATGTLQQTTPGNNLNISAGNDNITFTAGGRTFIFPTSGPASQTICTTGISCASGGGQAVLLQPGSAQTDTGSGSSIFINNTAGGNLLELQGAGSDHFVVSNAGNVTTGGTYNGQTISSSANFTGTVTIQGSSALTLGTASSNTGAIIFKGAGGVGTLTLQGPTTPNAGNFVLSLPTITGNDTVCTVNLGNCAGSGDGITGSGTSGTIPLFTGTNSIGNSILTQSGGTVIVAGDLNATNLLGDGSGLTNLNGSNISSGTVANARLVNNGALTVTAGTGLSGGGSVALGGSTTLNVAYGAVANTAVQGNTTLTCPTGTGNLTGGGDVITLGTGGTCSNLTITNSPTFTGTLAVQGAGGITVGVAGSVTGNLNLANATSSREVILQGLNPSGVGNATIQLPSIAGGSTDTVCLLTLGNCNASGAAGGDLTGSYPNPTIAKLQGTTLTLSSLASGDVLQYNGSAIVNGHITNSNLTAGSFGNITGTGALTSGSIGVGFGNINIGGNVFTGDGSGLTNLNGSNISSGTVANARLVNNGALTVTAGTGLSGGGSVALGGSTTLNVAYGAVANTAVQGNTTLTCPTGTGNLTGGGDVITLGTGGTCSNLTITNSPTFTGTLAVQGAGGITVGVAGSVTGNLNLANATSSREVILQGLNPSGVGNATIQLPSIAGGSTDTVCLLTLGNCAGPGGGITGSGTTGTIAIFTGTGSIGNSTLTQSGSTVTASGNLVIQGANALTLGTASTNTGSLAFKNSTNANTLTLQAGVTGSNLTLTLPTADGSNGNCLTTNGLGALSFTSCTGGPGGGVTSLDGLAGVLTINNSSGSGSAVTIDNAKADASTKGIATFNATNFTDNGFGVINTIQDIATSSSPVFVSPNATTGVNTGAGAGTQRIDASGNLVNIGTITSGLINGQTISSAANFTGTLAVQGAGGITVGVAGSVTGNLNLANATSSREVILQGLNPSGVGNATIQLPSIAGGSTDTVCLLTLGNCNASGAAGGDLTGSYPNPTIAKLQGTTLTLSSLASGDVLQYNGSAIVNGHITNSNLTAGSFTNITGTGALTSGSIASGFGTISTGNNITTTATVQGGIVNATTALQLGGVDINTAGTLSNVAYLNQANNFSAANTFSAAGTALSVTNNATIGGNLAIQGANALTLGTTGTNTGAIVFKGSTAASGTITLQGPANPSTSNYTLSIPTLTSNDTLCVATLANCTAIGAAGGDLTGSYPNPTIAKLQGTTLTLSSLASGDVLQYNGSAIVNGHITNSNLTAGSFGNITDVGTLASGLNIASGQTYKINSVDINTAGTLSNVAYLNGTGPQTFTGNNKFTGTFLAQNSADSTTAFQIQNQLGTSNLLIADTTNSRIGLGVAPITTAGSGLLQVGAASSTTAAQGISFGGDTSANLYRSAAGTLTTDGSLGVGSNLTAGGHGAIGSGASIVGSRVLNVSETRTDTSASAFAGLYGSLTENPGAISASIAYGGYVTAQNQSGNTRDITGGLVGLNSQAIQQGTGTIANLGGATNSAQVTGNGNVTTGYGSYNNYLASGSGTTTTAYGTTSFVGNNAGGTFTTASGLDVTVSNASTGTITTGYGLIVNSAVNSGGGTFSNNYGIYIQDQSGVGSVNSYNLYSAGATAKNYIAGTLQVGGTISVATLGTADTSTVLCRNSSNIIATCAGSGAGSPFVQGGNSFGATAVLGTNDTNSLAIETNGNTQVTIGTNGATTFQNSADSTTAFQIQNHAGTSNLLVADTTNSRIGLGVTPITTAGSGLLQVGAASSTTAAQGISFGGDTSANLYRSAASTLKTDGNFVAAGTITGTTLNGTTGINTGAGAGIQRIDNTGNLLNIATITSGVTSTAISGTNIDTTLQITASPASAPGAQTDFIGIRSTASSASANTNSNTRLFGASTNTSFTGSGTLGTSYGNFMQTSNAGSGTITTAFGGNGVILNNNNGNITTGTAIQGTINSTGTGTISNARAFDANIINNGGGTLTSAYGLKVETPTNTGVGSTIGTAYGVYIGEQSAASANYGLYFAGTAGTPIDGISWNADTNLYRSAAGVLKTDGSLAVATLGTADTSTVLCRNSSNIIATCAGSGAGSPFVQGGNSFGATAVLGTNDTNSLAIETNGNTQVTIGTNGATTFQNSADSTTAFQIQNHAGTSNLLVADTTNSRIGLGVTPITTAGSGLLQVGAASSTTAAQGISFGGDTSANLYRSAAGTLTTDGSLSVGGTYNTNTFTSSALTFGAAGTATIQSAASQALNITGHAASALSTDAGGLTIDTTAAGQTTQIDNSAVTHTVQIATGAAAQTVTVGSTNGASALTLQAGTGVLNITTQGTGSINIGANAAAQTIIIGNATDITTTVVNCGTGVCRFGATSTDHTTTLGSTTGVSATALQGGTGGITVGANGIANTIQIGNTTGAVAQAINIGNNATGSSSSAVVIGSTVAGTTTLQSAGGVVISTLGTADTSTVLCRNSSNIIATCAGSGAGSPFVQGGNSFGATAVLGTNDTNSLAIETNGNTQVTIGTNGATTFQNSADSTTAFQIQNHAGTSNLLVADTTNSRIGLGVTPITTAGSGLLQVGAASSTTAAQGISFGGDTSANLYRSAASTLKTDGTFNAVTAYQLNGANINTAGTLSNVAYLNAANTFTNVGANTFTGTVAIQGSNALTLGVTGTSTGAILFNGATGASGTLTLIGPANPTTNTLTLPNETGTLCSTGSVCTGYAPSSGGSYIAKNTNDTSSASFAGNLLGLTNTNTGAAGVLSLTNSGTNSALNILQSGTSEPSAGQALILANNNTAAPTGNLLDLQNKGGSKFSVNVDGAVTAASTYNTNTFNSNTLTFGAAGTATIQPASGQALTITANAASTWSTSAGNLTVQAATTNTLALDTGGAGTVNVGNTNATTVNIGNGTGATAVSVLCGTGTCGFGNNATDHSTTVGSINGTSATTLQSGTGGLNLSPSGGSNTGVLVKPGSNSTAAFQIQSSTSTVLFTADTTNLKVSLGSASSTPVLLILGNKNTTGDPTEVDGAMYFDSALFAFRCGGNGIWSDCAINQMDHSYEVEDEFVSGAANSSGQIGSLGWVNTTITGAAVTSYNSPGGDVADRPGILRMRTDGTANHGGTLRTQSSNGQGVVTLGAGQDVKTSVANFKNGQTNSPVLRVGLTNEGSATTAPTQGVWWEADTATNANWRYCYGDGAAAQCTATSVAVSDNSFYRLEIRITGTGAGTSSATFLINGSSFTVSGVTFGGGLSSPAMTCYASAAAAQDCFIDYMQFSGITSALR